MVSPVTAFLGMVSPVEAFLGSVLALAVVLRVDFVVRFLLYGGLVFVWTLLFVGAAFFLVLA